MKEKFSRIFEHMDPAMLIIIVILMVENFLRKDTSLSEWFYNKLIIIPGIIIGISFHEAAHGFASYWLGDPTPKIQGRLTLNPIRHMDPVGIIALLIAGFGWGRPVQIDPRYYKHKRRDEFIVSIAGVTTNLIIAILFSFLAKYMAKNFSYEFYEGVGSILLEIVVATVSINIVLMIFNLLPVPPLDGFGIVTQIFNLRKYQWYYPLYSKGSFILMFLIIFNVTSLIIFPLHGAIIGVLLG